MGYRSSYYKYPVKLRVKFLTAATNCFLIIKVTEKILIIKVLIKGAMRC